MAKDKNVCSIKVGGISYQVYLMDKVEIEGDSNYLGSCNTETSRIEIKRGLSEEKTEQVLIHELLHAIIEEASIESDNEEFIVTQLAPVLHQVLIDNKIIGALKKGS